jgi:hypothetical protein
MCKETRWLSYGKGSEGGKGISAYLVEINRGTLHISSYYTIQLLCSEKPILETHGCTTGAFVEESI